MDIVLKLRELRNHRGLSQKEVGRLSGIGEKTVSSFETGERIDSMKLDQLHALLTVYGVTEEEFFSDQLDQRFDPTYVRVSTRLDGIVERITDLPSPVQDGVIEAIARMVDAATLALPAPATHRQPPTAPVAAMSFRHTSAA